MGHIFPSYQALCVITTTHATNSNAKCLALGLRRQRLAMELNKALFYVWILNVEQIWKKWDELVKMMMFGLGKTEERSWQGRGQASQWGRQTMNPRFQERSSPKRSMKASNTAVLWRLSRTGTLRFGSKPSLVGLSGCPATTMKIKTAFFPIKPKRDVFCSPERLWEHWLLFAVASNRSG